MAMGRITKSSVGTAQPVEKDWLLWDDRLPGFGLKVTPAGSKVFLYQYRLGGRGSPVRRYTIGRFGKVTPEAARKIAEGLALKVTQGLDPQRTKVDERKRAVDLAFKPYVERFAEDYLRQHWPASWKLAHARLRAHAVTVLGDRPIPDIGRRDIIAVLSQVKDRPASARNLFAVLRRLFRWAVAQGDLDRSPMEGLPAPAKLTSRDRVLTDRELTLVWRASQTLSYPFGPMVRLLLLTGARREEVAALDWSELSREEQVWLLPANRAKNGSAARAPLSDMAVAELDELVKRSLEKSAWPREGFVFSTTGHSSVSGYSHAKQRLDKIIAELVALHDDQQPAQPWRLHDLRRTVATGLQRLGVRFEVTEAVLNHVSGSKGGVAGIYQRHDWADEKRAALQAWADHVERLLTGADKTNVVQLSGVRA